MPHFEPLAPLFAARVLGVDISRDVTETDFQQIRDAFERYPVLVFPDQVVDDAAQIAFSERFGPLETTRAGTKGAGSKVIVLTNLDEEGRIVPPTDKQVLNNRAISYGTTTAPSSLCRRVPPCCPPADPGRRGRHRVRQYARGLCGAARRPEGGGARQSQFTISGGHGPASIRIS